MPDISDEQEIFAAAEGLKEDDAPPPAPTPEEGEGQEEENAGQEQEGQDADPDSGEPEGQSQVDQQREPTRIAYSRFKEVNEDKKALRAELEAFRTAAAQREQQLLQMLQEASQRPAPTPQTPAKEETAEDVLVSLLTNPQDFLKQQLTPYEQKIAKLQDDILERDARSEHGAEAMSAAEKWIKDQFATNREEAIGLYQRIKASPNPYSALVREHKRQTALSRIGEDPDAFEARLREKIIAELKGVPPVQQDNPQPGTQRPTPPSALNRSYGSAGITEQGGITEEDIFNSAPAFGKKRA